MYVYGEKWGAVSGWVATQAVELREWWEEWCEKHKPSTPTVNTHVGLDAENEIDMDNIFLTDVEGHQPPPPPPQTSNVQDDISNSGSSTTDPKSRSVSIIAGAASLTFASGCLFIGYLIFMRRSKYARRRGVLTWLKLKVLEFRHGKGRYGYGVGSAGGLRRQIVPGTQGLDAYYKWSIKPVPSLPASGTSKVSSGSESRRSRKLYAKPSSIPGGEKKGIVGLFSRLVGKRDNSRGLYASAVVRTQDRKKRYSESWIKAQQKYVAEGTGENEIAEEYFRSKGISPTATAGKYMGLQVANGTFGYLDRVTKEEQQRAADTVRSPVMGKRYGDGGWGADEEVDEAALEVKKKQLAKSGAYDELIDVENEGHQGTDVQRNHTLATKTQLEDTYDRYTSFNRRTGGETPIIAASITRTRSPSLARHYRSSRSNSDRYLPVADISTTPHTGAGIDFLDSCAAPEGNKLDAADGLGGARGGNGDPQCDLGPVTTTAYTQYERYGRYDRGGYPVRHFEEVDLHDDDTYAWGREGYIAGTAFQPGASMDAASVRGGHNGNLSGLSSVMGHISGENEFAEYGSGYHGQFIPPIEIQPDVVYNPQLQKGEGYPIKSKGKAKWKLMRGSRGFLGGIKKKNKKDDASGDRLTEDGTSE
ncbi:hypothetical protein BDZ91DRAFT_786087 [Kalaharituber pfeilii]|nr:hypothetical protein BDZ91DRAFT_786087 [Kalaharituber pfeilii]